MSRGASLLIPYRTFESILRRLPKNGPTPEALAAAGLDVRAPRDAYPAEVWRAVIECTRAFAFADLEHEAGLRAVGRLAAEGFSETMVGRLYAWMLTKVGPRKMVVTVPRLLTIARPDCTVRVVADGENHWRVQCEMPCALPSFTAGLFEWCLERTGVTPQVEVAAFDGASRFELRIGW